MSDNLVCQISQDSTTVAHRKDTTEEIHCKEYKRVIKMSLLRHPLDLLQLGVGCPVVDRNGNRNN